MVCVLFLVIWPVWSCGWHLQWPLRGWENEWWCKWDLYVEWRECLWNGFLLDYICLMFFQKKIFLYGLWKEGSAPIKPNLNHFSFHTGFTSNDMTGKKNQKTNWIHTFRGLENGWLQVASEPQVENPFGDGGRWRSVWFPITALASLVTEIQTVECS